MPPVGRTRSFGRSTPPRVSVRRPSSTAASTCAARARPMCQQHDAEIVNRHTRQTRACLQCRGANRWRRPGRSARATRFRRTSARSSLSPSPAAPRRSSFSRGQSCGATAFIYTQILMRFSTGLARGLWLVVVLVAISCAEPPHKEMDRRRAPSMPRARPAPNNTRPPNSQRRRRLSHSPSGRRFATIDFALNYALESREQAQNAARTAADTRAKLRGDFRAIDCRGEIADRSGACAHGRSIRRR